MRDPVLPVPPPGGRLGRGLRAFVGALSDDELARRAGDGDEQAFAALFRRRADHLHAVAQRVLRDPDDARDAVQSALMKGLLAIRRGQPRGDVRPWMSRICFHEAIGILRVRTPWIELDERQHVASERSPEGAFLLREQLQSVAADLMVLPERQRRAFLLREVAGLPYDRVCGLLDLRADAARQAVHEARVALRELADGREDQCATVREILADADGRTRRSRRLRGHLRACEGCRDWERARRPRHPRRLAALLPGAWLPKLLVAGGAASTVSAGQLPTVAAVVAAVGGSGVLPVPMSPPALRHTPSAAAPRDAGRGTGDVRHRETVVSTAGGGQTAAIPPADRHQVAVRPATSRAADGQDVGGRSDAREPAPNPVLGRPGVEGARERGRREPAASATAQAEGSTGVRRTGAQRRDAAAATGSRPSMRPRVALGGLSRNGHTSRDDASRHDGESTTGATWGPAAAALNGAALSEAVRRIPTDEQTDDVSRAADRGAAPIVDDGDARPSTLPAEERG